MKLKIADIRSATDAEWDSFWSECNSSTYFHSREWAEIWQAYTKGSISPAPLLITFSDEKQAIIPISSTHIGKIIKSYVSSPAGTFGGWLSWNDLTAEHSRVICGFFCKRCKNLTWRINPYDESVRELQIEGVPDVTHVLDLTVGFDAIFKNWTKGHRSAVSKARRDAVSIRQAKNLADWHCYYDVYRDSIRRWGDKASSVYGLELFQAMMDKKSPNIRLWLAEHEEKIIAGALLFYSPRHSVYWHGAALDEYFALRPVNLLMYESIQDACERGLYWFDFNPSGGYEGVQSFKRSFGTAEHACPTIINRTASARFVETLKRKLRHG